MDVFLTPFGVEILTALFINTRLYVSAAGLFAFIRTDLMHVLSILKTVTAAKYNISYPEEFHCWG
jgi:hypothetical protein